MNQKSMNVIFFSKRCKDCNDLLTLLKNENLLGNFVLFCVDGRLNELPSGITMVPTMVVSGINKPLVGREPFEWVNKVKFLKQANMNNKMLMQQNLMRMAQKVGPQGFRVDEMTGISDTFAFTDRDKPLDHRYVNANDDKNAIFTAPEQEKISPLEQKKRIEKLENDRKMQDTQNSDIMKRQQLYAVMQAEQNETSQNQKR